MRNAGSWRDRVHRQPRPTMRGTWAPPAETGRERMGARGKEVEPRPILNNPTEPSWSALRGTKAARWRPATAPAAETRRFRLMAKRPSDRRSPRRNLEPQGAFEVSMINVSCNSH